MRLQEHQIKSVTFIIVFCQVVAISRSMPFICWHCNNARGLDECHLNGIYARCQSEEDVCATLTRRVFGKTLIWKYCKQEKACENERKQNAYQCGNKIFSLCRCCCHGSRCNRNELCSAGDANHCPRWNIEAIKHGKVECTNLNKIKSVCTASCIDEDYLINFSQDIECLKTQRWSHKKPCCTKLCPPYLQADITIMSHRQTPETARKREETIIKSLMRQLETGPDKVRWAVVFFSGSVDEETSMLFGHPVLHNSTTIRNGVKTGVPFRRTDDGLVHTGSALRFVKQRLLTKGHRLNHLDVVLIIIEANSDDSVQHAARTVRDDGALIYVIFLNFDGREVDKKQLRDLVGNTGKFFIVNGKDLENRSESIIAEMLRNMCFDVCEYY